MSVRSAIKRMMKAIRVTEFGEPQVLKVETNVPVPRPSEDQVNKVLPLDQRLSLGVRPHIPQTKLNSPGGRKARRNTHIRSMLEFSQYCILLSVLIKVHAAGINPVDTYIRSGTYAVKPTLPYTPGKDVAGVVEEVGSKVKHLKKGDRVYSLAVASGGYAEYCTSASTGTRLLHSNLTFEEGAGVGIPYYTAYRALVIIGGAKLGETVLIHGASGAVGLACVQIAKSRGLRVLGVAGSEAGIDLILRNGCDAAFSHREDGYAAKIMEATSNDGPQIIIEMLANVNLEKDLEMISKKGRIVVVGNRGSLEITPRLAMQKECIITGMLLFNASQNEMDEIDAAVSAGMRDGWVKPPIGKTYTLDQAPAAHNDIINNQGTLGRLIFKIC